MLRTILLMVGDTGTHSLTDVAVQRELGLILLILVGLMLLDRRTV